MERQIKFRAWNPQGKVMMDWLVFRQTAFNRDDRRLMYELFTRPDVFIPMQFTGLLDKNGTEIYEGDILLVQYYGDPKKVVVTYHETDAEFFPLSSYDKSEDGYYYKNHEVIGNIYENPELLAVSDEQSEE